MMTEEKESIVEFIKPEIKEIDTCNHLSLKSDLFDAGEYLEQEQIAMAAATATTENDLPEWNDHETTVLIDFWEKSVIQFCKYGRKIKFDKQTAKHLQEIAHTPHMRTVKEIKQKIGSLKKIYRVNKKEVFEDGSHPPKWKYFDKINNFQKRSFLRATLRYESQDESMEDLSNTSINGEDVDVAALPSLPDNETVTSSDCVLEEGGSSQPSTSKSDFEISTSKQPQSTSTPQIAMAAASPTTTKNYLPQWSDHETTVLIDLWEKRVIQSRSTNRKFNNQTAKHLQQIAHTPHMRSGNEIRRKIETLKKKYKLEKKWLRKTGSGPSKWKYYNKINKFLQTSPLHDTSLIHESQVESMEDLSNTSINGEDVDVAALPSLPDNETVTSSVCVLEDGGSSQPSTSKSGCEISTSKQSQSTSMPLSKPKEKKASSIEKDFNLTRQDLEDRLSKMTPQDTCMHDEKLISREKEKYEKLNENYIDCKIRLGIIENDRERLIANEAKLKAQVDDLNEKLRNAEIKIAIMQEKEKLRDEKRGIEENINISSKRFKGK